MDDMYTDRLTPAGRIRSELPIIDARGSPPTDGPAGARFGRRSVFARLSTGAGD